MIQILQYVDSYQRHESVWKYDGTKLANYYHRYCGDITIIISLQGKLFSLGEYDHRIYKLCITDF